MSDQLREPVLLDFARPIPVGEAHVLLAIVERMEAAAQRMEDAAERQEVAAHGLSEKAERLEEAAAPLLERLPSEPVEEKGGASATR